MIADLPRDVIEWLQGDPGLEVLWSIGRARNVSYDVLIRSVLFDLPLGIDPRLGKQVGPMDVERRCPPVEPECIDRSGEALREVGMAQMLAYHRAVLAFDQGVVIALPGATPGLFDGQLLQPLGYLRVEVR